MIHALTGTVSAIDSQSGSITVLQDDHSTAVFPKLSKTPSSFDKRIAAQTTAAEAFDKSGAYAIVFYVGDGDSRKVVALKSLGDGPFSSTTGTVEKFDRAHFITVRDDAGALITLRIGPGTVAETNFGAVDGQKFQAGKGDHVRIVSGNVDGAPTALFVRDL
jgi:hypothetical protein